MRRTRVDYQVEGLVQVGARGFCTRTAYAADTISRKDTQRTIYERREIGAGAANIYQHLDARAAL